MLPRMEFSAKKRYELYGIRSGRGGSGPNILPKVKYRRETEQTLGTIGQLDQTQDQSHGPADLWGLKLVEGRIIYVLVYVAGMSALNTILNNVSNRNIGIGQKKKNELRVKARPELARVERRD